MKIPPPRGFPITPSPQELEEAIERMLADPNREITPPDRLQSAIYAWKGGRLEDFKSFSEQVSQFSPESQRDPMAG